MTRMQDGAAATPATRVLIADEVSRVVRVLEQLAEYAGEIEPCGLARTPKALVHEVRRSRPDVVLLNTSLGGGVDVGAVARDISSASPRSRLVLIRGDSSLAKKEDLVAAIRRAHPRPTRRARADTGAAQPETQQGQIFLVFAGKGGVGKSVVSCNLAAALSRSTDARVAVMDLDLQFGDVAVMLGVENHTPTIESIANKGDKIRASDIEPVLAKGPSGIDVLVAPPSPELADLVSAGAVRAIVRELARTRDFVVVDAGTHIDERVLDVMEAADHIVIVSALTVTAVKDTKITLKILNSLGVDSGKIALVLNQTRARSPLPREDIEERLGRKALAHLPYEPRIVDDAIDQGSPFVVAEPKSDIARRLQELADELAGDEVGGERKRGGRLRGRQGQRRRFAIGRR